MLANAAVYDDVPLLPCGTPVSGSKLPTSWRRFSSSVSAGRYPSPFRVSTCTHDRSVVPGGVTQCGLERVEVVAVDRAAYARPSAPTNAGTLVGSAFDAMRRETVGAYERPLSFRTTTTRRPL